MLSAAGGTWLVPQCPRAGYRLHANAEVRWAMDVKAATTEHPRHEPKATRNRDAGSVALGVLGVFRRDRRPEVLDLRVAPSALEDRIYGSASEADFAQQRHLDDRL